MTAVTVSSILGNIQTYATNPASIQRAALATLDRIHDGTVSVVDATNPFVFSIENTSVNVAAFLQQNAALTRRLYPASAATVSDLYLHMSDTDYINAFALPSTASFTLMINQQQLLNALVTDVSTGISKVTIPRNTVFYAAGIPFSLQYPITIRRLNYGDIQITYDATQTSPLQTLVTNVIPYGTLKDTSGVTYVEFSVDTQQFDIVERINDVNSTGGFTTKVPFAKQFYYARVYSSDTNGNWVEMAVTYTQEVYDLTTPTAVVSVADNVATVTIPVVYVTTGQISGKVRVDIYETMGPLNLLLGNYSPNDFSADFMYLDSADASVYTAAFTTLTGIAVFSQDTTTGGRNALTFDQLQTRVINNSIGPRNIPITPSQIQTTLLDLGYTLVKNIDTITDRAYWATKPLPAPTSPNLVTAANASVVTMITSLAAATAAHGCVQHATGMTITSAALIQTANGVSTLLSQTAYSALVALPAPQLCAAVNAGNYTYTPFYYVLDTTTDTFEVRPYYLDTPKVVSRSFIQENPATGLQVSIAPSYSLIKTSTGYQLTIATASNAAYQALPDAQVYCQLAFTSSAQATPAYMLGTQLTRTNNAGERIYVFNLPSTYDISSSHQMLQSAFATATGAAARSDLRQTFSVLFCTSATLSGTVPATAIDTALGAFQLPPSVRGITQEQVTLQFGYTLSTLWNSYRSIVAPVPYQTYSVDIPATYDKDVYQVDPVTGAFFTVGTNGQLVYNKLHSAGDAKVTPAGVAIYAHRAGDPIISSATGLPVPTANYQTQINRSLDLLVLDGVYQFANDAVTLEYVAQINSALITSLTRDLMTLNEEVLDRTEIYYYPAISKGNINVVADNNRVLNIEAAQQFSITIYVAPEVYANAALIASLESTTIQTIGTYLSEHTTVAVSQLEEAMSIAYGSDVLGVNMTGLGGDANYKVITVTESSSTLSINKVLALQPNNTLAVKEDISIVFETHTSGR